MSLRFRQSVRLFPGVRLNFSRSGVSTTVGVRGASVTLGRGGTHLNLGVPGTGVSYRTRVAGRGADPRDFAAPPALSPPEFAPAAEDIRSAGTEALTSPGLGALKQLILDAGKRRERLAAELADVRRDLGQVRGRLSFANLFIVRLFTAVWTARLEEKVAAAGAKVEVLEHDLTGCGVEVDFGIGAGGLETYAELTDAFMAVAGCAAIWDVTASAATNRAAERTSAFEALARTPVRFDQAGLNLLRTPHPVLRLGEAQGRDLHLYPGFLLMKDATDFALIEYGELQTRFGIVPFIETLAAPMDAEVAGQTWAKANKDGSQDLRFRDNRPLPILHYGKLALTSGSGLNEVYLVSNRRAARRFADALLAHQAALADQHLVGDLEGAGDVAPPEIQTDQEPPGRAASSTVKKPLYLLDWAVMAAVLILGIFVGTRGPGQSVSPPPPMPVVVAEGPLTSAQRVVVVRPVQAALLAKGYSPGPADGMMGGRTRKAIAAYQAAAGLTASGELDRATLAKLGIAP
jgi:hypothetical protein